MTAWLRAPFHRALLGLMSLACLWLLVQPWMFGKEHLQLVHVFAWGSVTSIMYFGWLLLLIHGGDGATPSFRHLIPLRTKTHRVIAIGLPSQGFTVLGSKLRGGLTAMAEEVKARWLQENWQPLIVVGHSAGAALALRMG